MKNPDKMSERELRLEVKGTRSSATAMIEKIDACLMRVLKSKPDGTTIRLADDEWIVKGEGLI